MVQFYQSSRCNCPNSCRIRFSAPLLAKERIPAAKYRTSRGETQAIEWILPEATEPVPSPPLLIHIGSDVSTPPSPGLSKNCSFLWIHSQDGAGLETTLHEKHAVLPHGIECLPAQRAAGLLWVHPCLRNGPHSKSGSCFNASNTVLWTMLSCPSLSPPYTHRYI